MEKINRQKGIAPLVTLLIVIGFIGIGGGIVYVRKSSKDMVRSPSPTPTVSLSPSLTVEVMPDQKPEIKEFSMTSWYEMKDGKASTNFSLKEIKVKKGDIVRIKVTNTKGNHDFSLDEYDIKKLTPLNQEITIEFAANKVGSFKYYCSVAGHRMMGQEGIIIVEE